MIDELSGKCSGCALDRQSVLTGVAEGNGDFVACGQSPGLFEVPAMIAGRALRFADRPVDAEQFKPVEESAATKIESAPKVETQCPDSGPWPETEFAALSVPVAQERRSRGIIGEAANPFTNHQPLPDQPEWLFATLADDGKCRFVQLRETGTRE